MKYIASQVPAAFHTQNGCPQLWLQKTVTTYNIIQKELRQQNCSKSLKPYKSY